jgi:long-chain acyl-CoA synthetase
MAYPRVRGRKNLRELKGPLLFVSNHITKVDIGFILAALPFRFRHRLAVAMIGEMLREMRDPPPGSGAIKRLTGKLSYVLVVALFNVFPLPQTSGFRRETLRLPGESADGDGPFWFSGGEANPGWENESLPGRDWNFGEQS